MTKIISVFGGSSPQPGSAAYHEAMQMGRLLAQAGYTVATGGYNGVMAAVSCGATEVGGHVIGVTCNLLESWREGLAANSWVKQEIKFGSLRERLYHLVSFCDAAVALGGGIGTLSEVSLMWSLMQTNEIPRKPLVLVGPLWRKSLSEFLQHAEAYVGETDKTLLAFADQVDGVLELLKNNEAG